jgi:hypothetical protein
VRHVASLASLSLIASFTAAAAAHEPWVDPDPDGPPERYELTDDVGIAAEAEYRAQWTNVDPIALNSEKNRRFNLIEQRGRITGIVDYKELIKVNVSLDLLDTVLWGDNGTFGGDPSSDSGLQVTTRDPTLARPCVELIDPDRPLEADGYGWSLCEADPIKVRRLYAQVTTPIGALRIGRQPVSVGMGVQTSEGSGRENRWGVSYEGDSVDRLLFATKPLEAFKPKSLRNTSEYEGLIIAIAYDRLVSDSLVVYGDDVHSIAEAIRYLEPDFGIGTDLEVQVFHAHRWDNQYNTRVNTIGGRAIARFGGLHVGVDMAGNIGSTREVSTAYAVVTNDPIVDQDILQYGARAVVRYDWRPDGATNRPPMLTGLFEFDYASGDGDPQSQADNPLSQFRFSEDTNVGLLMFEHVVRFQSAKAAAAGVEITRRLGAETFPAERVDTRGAFTGAMAIFPQVDFRPHDDVLIRAGVLVAWAPEVIVDPVQSLQGRDGLSIEDDLVNFVGGKPGDFYGAEIDARFQWRFLDHFTADLEGAVLFPGDALEDVNGHAVTSFMVQGRTTVFF